VFTLFRILDVTLFENYVYFFDHLSKKIARTCNYFVVMNYHQHVIVAFFFYFFSNVLVSNNIQLLFLF
jgi:hypothetical protein